MPKTKEEINRNTGPGIHTHEDEDDRVVEEI